MHVLVTFVPPHSTEAVLSALFAAGAGNYGNYDHCAFVCAGEGRFRPLAGSSPFIGTTGQDERFAENRIELLVADDAVNQVLEALRQSHPYEEPAIYLFKLDERALPPQSR
ncbi:NGG1p interacting factor NIF3 [Gracilinema caldarium]|uniref:NGG1p interacting factor NIF3 n=1 Tax=Gracilinema caldarium TaxID=215591 RepID=UPI0026EE0C9A|nr:NGG1p interacting factor NIF3 [Gracilinema caldarium]